MGAISSVNSYNSVNYGNFASGRKIQTAANGASELAIIQKMERQERGTNAASENIKAGIGMLNISDGALGQITDDLQRMGELALRATSPLMTDDDRAAIQSEIDQLKEGISDIANRTTYNEHKLLDGSESNYDIVTNTDGSNKNVTTGNATLESLGIADFTVTGTFDVSAIDNALKKVASMRSASGAQTNALEHAFNNNNNYSWNITSSKSRLEDLDYPKAISEMKKKELLQEYQMHMQRKRMEDKKNQMARMFS